MSGTLTGIAFGIVKDHSTQSGSYVAFDWSDVGEGAQVLMYPTEPQMQRTVEQASESLTDNYFGVKAAVAPRQPGSLQGLVWVSPTFDDPIDDFGDDD